MPELPEVHTFAQYIKKQCRGLTIQNVVCNTLKLAKPSCAVLQRKLKGAKIKNVSQRGKYVLINFSNIPETLIIHFGMSGSVHSTKSDEPLVGNDRYARIIFVFSNNHELRWIDKRKFGKVMLVASLEDVKALKTMGPDPLTITKKQFFDLLDKHASQKMKTFFMQQKNIGGIGNEYSDEILYRAGVNPLSLVKDLNLKKRALLYQKMKHVLKDAIKLKRPYGQFNPKIWLQAHRKKGDHCPKSNTHILKISKINGRTSYWCPICQPE